VTPFTLRQLAQRDAAYYRALRLRGLREHPEAFTSSVEEEEPKPMAWTEQRLAPNAERPHDFFLGAFVDGRLLGVAGLMGRYRPKERHNATLVGMYVAPELAGRGAGLALVRGLVQRAARFPGLEQIDLTVTAGNDRAQGLYARCGFTVVGILPRAIKVQGAYHDKVQMLLRLP